MKYFIEKKKKNILIQHTYLKKFEYFSDKIIITNLILFFFIITFEHSSFASSIYHGFLDSKIYYILYIYYILN